MMCDCDAFMGRSQCPASACCTSPLACCSGAVVRRHHLRHHLHLFHAVNQNALATCSSYVTDTNFQSESIS